MTRSAFALRFGFAVAVFILVTSLTGLAALCPLNPTNPSVTICAPAVNATVSNPVNIVAGSTDSSSVIAMAASGVRRQQRRHANLP